MMSMIFSIIGLGIMLGILGLIGFGLYALFKKFIGTSVKAESGEKSDTSPLKDQLIVRILLAVVLILVSLLPLSFVGELVGERSSLYNQVSNRMTQEWGGAQIIHGPVLSVPYQYTDYVTDRIENKSSGEIKHQKRPVERTKLLFILPESLKVKTDLETKELSRSIYKVPIYSSKSKLEGTFKWPDISALRHAPETFLWNKSKIVFLISETKGIEGGTNLTWDGQVVDLSSGTGLNGLRENFQGVHARLNLTEDIQSRLVPFEFDLNMRGSRSIAFAPTGKDSEIVLNANWGDPSFEGQLLPSNRNITEESFQAEWRVTHLSRSYEQFKALSETEPYQFFNQIRGFNFGASLFQTVDLYSLLERTTKYGIMFVSLTFFSLFILEFATGRQMHWIQHLIIGAALSMFYLCLLSISEHIPFAYAYGIGVVVITSITSIYAWAATKRLTHGLSLGGIMIALYAILFSILQMEDFALLIGTILLLAFLVAGMFVTRNLGHKPQILKE